MTAQACAFELTKTPKSPPLLDSTLIDVMDDTCNPGAAHAGISLEWRDVTVHKQVKSKKMPAESSPPILSAVNGFAAPGELLVVMGPSGAGKTALLNVLSGRSSAGLSKESSVTVNGQLLAKSLATRHTAFVPPNDLFHDALTVREHLLFQASFHRTHTRHSEQERQHRVEHVLEENGLDEVRDLPIGAILTGLKKRLAIASQLVGHASILLVDEPNSGLDNFTAVSIVSQLKHIATRGNKTVVAAISKPSSEVFALFDKVLLLGAGGKVVYHGQASDAVGYFMEHGHPCPPYFNAADFLVTLVSIAPALPSLPWEDADRGGLDAADNADRTRIESLAQAWEVYRHSEVYNVMLLPHEHEASNVVEPGFKNDRESVKGPHALAPAKTSGIGRAMHEFALLARRNVARLLGNKLTFMSLTVQPIVIAVVIGLIYLQPDMNQIGMQSYSSALFIFVVALVMMNANAQLAGSSRDLALALREHQAGLYHIASWYLAKNVTEVPLQIIQPIVFLLPAYFLLGIGHGIDLFVYLAVILMLAVSTAFGYAYMVASIVRRPGLVPVIGLVSLIPLIILGGALVNSKAIRGYFIWIAFLSPFKYAYEAVMNLFWARVDSISCSPAATCTTSTGLAVLASRSLTDRTPWTSGLLLLALNVGFRLIGLLSLLMFRN